MKLNIELLKNMISKRDDGGASKRFLTEVPEYIEKSIFGDEDVLCTWDSVPCHKDMFLNIRDEGIKNPVKLYWDECGIELSGYHRVACAIALGQKEVEAEFNINVLMVMAHPDDEVIFGWPIMQDTSIKKSLLICSSDLHNPLRPVGRNRRDALEKVCKHLQIDDFTCLDYPSEFYRLETRKCTLKKMLNNVAGYIENCKRTYAPVVFTHNIFGEYGNIDHILTNYVCMGKAKHVMYTDITQQSNWMGFQDITDIHKGLFFQNPLLDCTLNIDFYNECKNIYKEHKCWTWDKEPVKKCKVYIE